MKVSTPEQIVIIPFEVTNESSKDQGNSDLIISSNFKTSTIDTSTSLPPFVSINPTATHSPTFDNIINQPITSLFSSQSTDPPITPWRRRRSEWWRKWIWWYICWYWVWSGGGKHSGCYSPSSSLTSSTESLIHFCKFKMIEGVSILYQVSKLACCWNVKKVDFTKLLMMWIAITRKGWRHSLLVLILIFLELKAIARERHVLLVQDVKKVREYVNFKN